LELRSQSASQISLLTYGKLLKLSKKASAIFTHYGKKEAEITIQEEILEEA